MIEPWPALLIALALVIQAELFWAYRNPIGRLLDFGGRDEVSWHLGWPWVSGGVGLILATTAVVRLWSSASPSAAIAAAALVAAIAGLGYWLVRSPGR